MALGLMFYYLLSFLVFMVLSIMCFTFTGTYGDDKCTEKVFSQKTQ